MFFLDLLLMYSRKTQHQSDIRIPLEAPHSRGILYTIPLLLLLVAILAFVHDDFDSSQHRNGDEDPSCCGDSFHFLSHNASP